MDGLNKVMLLGRLTADPELRFTQGGQAVLNIRMATNETFLDKDKQKQERTEFHSVVVWAKRAEGLAKILKKGDALFIEGGIRTSSYEDRDGQKRYKVEIHATNVVLTGGGNRGAAPDDGAPAPRDNARASAPAGRGDYGRSGGAAPRTAPAAAAPLADDYDGGGYGGGDDSDIPFDRRGG